MPASLRVTLRKSPISYKREAHGAVRALGLHRIGDSRVLPDTDAVRGQVRAIRFLVTVEELPEAPTTTIAPAPAASTDEPAPTAPPEEAPQ